MLTEKWKFMVFREPYFLILSAVVTVLFYALMMRLKSGLCGGLLILTAATTTQVFFFVGLIQLHPAFIFAVGGAFYYPMYLVLGDFNSLVADAMEDRDDWLDAVARVYFEIMVLYMRALAHVFALICMMLQECARTAQLGPLVAA